jgi:MFS family permease
MRGPAARLTRLLPEDLRGRALGVVLGCLVCQMGLGYGYVFGPLAKDLLEEFGWSRAQYSGARGPQLLVTALSSPLLGALTVRYGARPILVGSTLLLGFAFAGVSGIGSLWQLYALIMLQGLVVTGLGDIAVGQVVSQWVVRSRGLALGIVYTGSNLGGTVLTRAAAWLADHESWRAAFATLGLGGLALLLPCAAWLVRDPPRAGAPVAVGEAASGGPARKPVSREPARNPASGEPAAAPGPELDLRAALRTRSFWILAGSLFTFFFYFLGMLEHLVLFLTDEGMPRAEAAAHFSNAILLGMVSKIAFGWLADRIPRRAAILLDYALLASSSLLLLALPRPGLLPLFVFTYGFATAARDVVTPLMIVECFGVRYLAQIYGALMLVLLPGGALGPLFAAAVHDRTGSYSTAFLVFAVLNCLALASLPFLRPEAPRLAAR